MISTSQREIEETASKGPIVIINVRSYRCDAFLMKSSGVEYLELPKASLSVLTEKDPRSYDTLEWMWNSFVKEILHALRICGVSVANTRPHVWWIPIGPLVKVPLHAARYHLSGQTNMTVMDPVTSSYGSSINSMRQSRKNQNTTPSLSQSRIVLVAMQRTPGVWDLKRAGNEISVVESICSLAAGVCVRPNPIHDNFSRAMETCTILHFAGHGNPRVTNPLDSLLLLED
jgi:CHAT domain-containing protein